MRSRYNRSRLCAETNWSLWVAVGAHGGQGVHGRGLHPPHAGAGGHALQPRPEDQVNGLLFSRRIAGLLFTIPAKMGKSFWTALLKGRVSRCDV
jgi:hypothetical protein